MNSKISAFFLRERYILTAVFLNTAIIVWMYFPGYRYNLWLSFIDHLFLLFFVLEIAIKIKEYTPKRFFSSWWNRFDFFIVLASLPSLFEYASGKENLYIFIVLRLFRLISMVRFLRFVPHLSDLLAGLQRALKASVLLLLLLVFMNFMLALLSCHSYSDIAPEYFGNPLIAAYSVFQLFTVEGWNEIPATIVARTGNLWVEGFTRFYFVLVVLVGGIFGMSIANAVFVDEMIYDNTQDIENKIDLLQIQLAEIQQQLNRLTPPQPGEESTTLPGTEHENT